MTSPRAKRAPAPRATGVQLGEDVARSRIMFGAVRVFATLGIRAATVEDLLEAGQVSRRTFYRFFTSKDDVALAVYTFGTATLLENCRRAIASVPDDLLAQLEKCIDNHLTNAQTMGRLIYVLGGEAHRVESPLHARRMEVHDALVEMLAQGSSAAKKIDPLLGRTLIFAIEAVVRSTLRDGDEGRRVTPASIARARRVMLRVATGAVAGSGARVSPMPTPE